MMNPQYEQMKGTVIAFAQALHQNRKGQVEQMNMSAQPVGLPAGEQIDTSGKTTEWLKLSEAASGLTVKTEENCAYVSSLCHSLVESVFGGIPGMNTSIPEGWYKTKMGGIWATAFIWSQGDDLITLTDAAELSGKSRSGLYANKKLNRYTNPDVLKQSAARTLVSRTQVVALFGVKSPSDK